MNLEILSPDEPLFTGEASSVVLPGASGRFSILDHHAPLLSTLMQGEIVVDGGKFTFPIHKGVVEVVAGKVTVLVQA